MLTAAARDAARHDAHVAELGAGAEPAAEESVARDDRAADARADREHHHVADEPAGAEAELRPAGGVRVVVDDDGGADAGLELLAERLVAPVDVRGVVHRRLGGVDEACRGDADRRSGPSAESDSIMATTASSRSCTIACRGGTRSLRTIAPNSSTTAPAIFVPPMSIPIACTRKPPFEG